MHMNESFTLQCVVSLRLNNSHSEVLGPGSGVFYLRGTVNKRVPATIVGPSAAPDCVAVQCECICHSQLYLDCPLDHLTFPISCAQSSWAPESHGPFSITRLPSPGQGCGQLQPSTPLR
uniref:Uncharacterized protein n=1 Tax=Eutreptiella gymnastica TaxID=73025 RepID=A0A7S4FZN3_9EUGL